MLPSDIGALHPAGMDGPVRTILGALPDAGNSIPAGAASEKRYLSCGGVQAQVLRFGRDLIQAPSARPTSTNPPPESNQRSITLRSSCRTLSLSCVTCACSDWFSALSCLF